MNMTGVVYIGNRPGIRMDWNRRGYIFKPDKKIMVPDTFADELVRSGQFLMADQVERTVEENYPEGGCLVFRRQGAMGDLIMFRAATSAFLRVAGDKYAPILRCQERFVHMFEGDPIWAGVLATARPAALGVVGVCSFDQVAEADHRGTWEHRALLFLKAMTKQSVTITVDDWQIPIPESVGEWVRRHLSARVLLEDQRERPLLAVQISGSGKMKSLPPDVVRELVKDLLTIGDVMLIESDEKKAKPYMLGPRVFSMTHRDALHGIELLKHVDLAVTMDSGPLWMAHAAVCPVLAILGPTRPEQRISFHPLYPQGARAVCLNEIIECPACFEAAKACERAYTCMQKQPDWARPRRMIVEAAEEMLKLRIRLPLAAPGV